MASNDKTKASDPLRPDFEKIRTPTEKRAAEMKPGQDFRDLHKYDGQFGYGDGGFGINDGMASARHDPAYYEKWRKEQAEAVARGEDPYADFAKRAREHSDNQPFAKMANRVGKFFGKGGKSQAPKEKDSSKKLHDDSEDDGAMR